MSRFTPEEERRWRAHQERLRQQASAQYRAYRTKGGRLFEFLHQLQTNLAKIRSDIKYAIDGHPIRFWGQSKGEATFKASFTKKCIETRDMLNLLIADLEAPLIDMTPQTGSDEFIETDTQRPPALPKPTDSTLEETPA